MTRIIQLCDSSSVSFINKYQIHMLFGRIYLTSCRALRRWYTWVWVPSLAVTLCPRNIKKYSSRFSPNCHTKCSGNSKKIYQSNTNMSLFRSGCHNRISWVRYRLAHIYCNKRWYRNKRIYSGPISITIYSTCWCWNYCAKRKFIWSSFFVIYTAFQIINEKTFFPITQKI